MILIVGAGTNLTDAGEIGMFIAEDVPTALAEWQACFEHNGQIPDMCSPVPKKVDVYNVVPLIDDFEVEQ